MKIADLKVNQKADLDEATVTAIDEARSFVRFGRPIRVATATIKDDTGTMKMSLWNEDIEKVKVGDKIKVTNGFCKEFQGEKQITTGRLGKLEVIGKDESVGEGEESEAEVQEEIPEAEATEEKIEEP